MDSPLLNVHRGKESCKIKGLTSCVHPVEGKWMLWRREENRVDVEYLSNGWQRKLAAGTGS